MPTRFFRPLLKPLSPYGLAFCDFIEHDGVEHAGYLAFLFLLGVFPFIVFLTALTGMFGGERIGFFIADALIYNEFLPPDVARSLAPRIREIASGPPQQLLTLAIVGAIWTASSMVEGMRTIFNRAYRIYAPPPYVLRRLMSIGQLLLMTGVTVGVIAALVVIPGVVESFSLGRHVKSFLFELSAESGMRAFAAHYWYAIRMGTAAAVLFCVALALYAAVPNAAAARIRLAPGAFASVALWFASGKLLSLYLAEIRQVQIIYGSLGGVIATLIFFYFAAAALIYGAELNHHMGRRAEKKKADVFKAQ
ncbi:MAG: YihY/virulence factor BrkB family protein [Rickettsiales bacterium]